MKKRGVNELRQLFLDYFETKGHLKMKSFSLVPHNDKSLLLINSGMAPLKPYFTGQEIPPSKRVATCQKCIRTGDIENVGKTARHGTFFEMLGNFSFGDYFKKESLEWTWEFLTEVVGLDADRLYPSVYLEDDEAWEIWNKDIGIAPERIFRFGKEDNFWEHGAGPCGPCSEVYYDRGEKFGCGKEDCTVGCDCDRYMEIWNNVFTQFNNDGNNNYTELEQKNIDTGMGLERLACVVQEVDSMFDVDTIKALREAVCQLAKKEYGVDDDTDVSIRVVTDHIRSVSFMISDGIMPSNEGRGYVLRRLLRRACRHGRLLGIEGEFLVGLARDVIDGSKDGYPELDEKREFIFKVVAKEEEQFNKTIDKGLVILSEMEKQMEERKEKILSGEDAFRLYDTYGFPIDLTIEILEEKNLGVDEAGFKVAMEKQKELARGSWKTTNYMGADATVYEEIDPAVTSEFVGYDHEEFESKITVLTTATEIVEGVAEGDRGTIFVDQTPFYATSGGQEADRGIIAVGDSIFVVEDVVKLLGGKIGHIGYVKQGMFKTGDQVLLTIDRERRNCTARNHSATHLLHKALKMVLGNHVEQAGSFVDSERLRFDFTHFSALTAEEIKKVEKIVNKEIMADLPVTVRNMPIEEARKTGAAALFGEKYGDVVRVVTMGDFSIELCGGTHVKNTGSLMAFKIISETSVAAGVRRIEALTSAGLFDYFDALEARLNGIAASAKTTPDKLGDKVSALMKENKGLHSEIESLKSQMAKEAMGDVSNQIEDINGVKIITTQVEQVDMNGLRDLGDQLKNKIGEGVIVIASKADGRVNLLAMATEEAMKKGAHAGNLIKEIAGLVGGGGGGRPNMAQAGGKNPEGIDGALEKAKEVLSSQTA
ncbi:alanyl-tRNA synthetase [Aequitasia blattaphilus]|uniref:Alanine--tRNA ligase n=1 Tax=Aequitasia blattaphilus TaxID=2949332 RepID=A0ABT1E5M7_9FIRM|nr:alanine--tRNA ligase [Aequitasia blattaphilus]MCP1101150.1 alanine--tRNA ligase [Aequitasia blattaphilus]MCR8613790.1 alanine--tRNA ligase [Aequitasia blattaphilus]